MFSWTPRGAIYNRDILTWKPSNLRLYFLRLKQTRKGHRVHLKKYNISKLLRINSHEIYGCFIKTECFSYWIWFQVCVISLRYLPIPFMFCFSVLLIKCFFCFCLLCFRGCKEFYIMFLTEFARLFFGLCMNIFFFRNLNFIK